MVLSNKDSTVGWCSPYQAPLECMSALVIQVTPDLWTKVPVDPDQTFFHPPPAILNIFTRSTPDMVNSYTWLVTKESQRLSSSPYFRPHLNLIYSSLLNFLSILDPFHNTAAKQSHPYIGRRVWTIEVSIKIEFRQSSLKLLYWLAMLTMMKMK